MSILTNSEILNLGREKAQEHLDEWRLGKYRDSEWLKIFSSEAQNEGLDTMSALAVADAAWDYLQNNSWLAGVEPVMASSRKLGLDALNIALNDGQSAIEDPRAESNETTDRAPWAEKGTEVENDTSMMWLASKAAKLAKICVACECGGCLDPKHAAGRNKEQDAKDFAMEPHSWMNTDAVAPGETQKTYMGIYEKQPDGNYTLIQDMSELGPRKRTKLMRQHTDPTKNIYYTDVKPVPRVLHIKNRQLNDGPNPKPDSLKSSSKMAAGFDSANTFAPNSQREINRGFDKMPARYSDEPWQFDRKRRERGTKPSAPAAPKTRLQKLEDPNDIWNSKAEIKPKKQETPKVDFHETSRHLPPRDDMKRHLTEDIKDEIHEDTHGDIEKHSDSKMGERTIMPETQAPKQPSPYRYRDTQTQPIAEDPHSKGAPSWVTSSTKKASFQEMWDHATPRGRCLLLGTEGKPTSTLFFRSWDDLADGEKMLLNRWIKLKQDQKAASAGQEGDWLDFVAQDEESAKTQFMQDPQMQEIARMEATDMDTLWGEIKEEYLANFHDPMP